MSISFGPRSVGEIAPDGKVKKSRAGVGAALHVGDVVDIYSKKRLLYAGATVLTVPMHGSSLDSKKDIVVMGADGKVIAIGGTDRVDYTFVVTVSSEPETPRGPRPRMDTGDM